MRKPECGSRKNKKLGKLEGEKVGGIDDRKQIEGGKLGR